MGSTRLHVGHNQDGAVAFYDRVSFTGPVSFGPSPSQVRRENREHEFLPCAEGAAFDSFEDEHQARCHPDTRIELLRHIENWADDPHGKSIYWLSGLAGTGKSTISRTIAQSFADQGKLGASFFFKRGEGERGNASRIFTTIAAQLTRNIPALLPRVREAIGKDSGIAGRTLKKQFDALILQPLSELGRTSSTRTKLALILDALDECERASDIRDILVLLSQARQLGPVQLRILVTSRPELPIRLCFKRMSADIHQDVILDDISGATIKRDITCFLEAEFERIRDDHNCTYGPDSALPLDWPGEQRIQALSRMAVPLFLFAATACRSIGDSRWDPEERLTDVLRYQWEGQASNLDKTYMPILSPLLADLKGREKQELIREFRTVVGSIVVLEEPLGTAPLSTLLGISRKIIDRRLDGLHSVLSIPSDPSSPVRLFHLSFREFLVDPEKQEENELWINQGERHGVLANRCLERMCERLHENLCHLEPPGRLRDGIDRKTIDIYLSRDVEYACRYWVHHVKEASTIVRDGEEVHIFLQKHFLHWLEALSLVGGISGSLRMIETLQSLTSTNEGMEVSSFLADARRFLLQYRWMIGNSPLQLYSSALIFAPRESLIRKTFEKPIPWIRSLPRVPRAWSPELQRLEDPRGEVSVVVFSPDGQLLALASSDKSIRLWDPATGEEVRTILDAHAAVVFALAFSPDGQLLASASRDCTVKVWDPTDGVLLHHFYEPNEGVIGVAFSPDGQLLTSALNDMHPFRRWNEEHGRWVHQRRPGMVYAEAISPNGQLLASARGSYDTRIGLWSTRTGDPAPNLEWKCRGINGVACSPNSQLLASAPSDNTARLRFMTHGKLVQVLEGHTELVVSVAFSPDSKLLASASRDKTVRLWSSAIGEQLRTFKGHTDRVNVVEFSRDGQLLASASHDMSVRLWDLATADLVRELKGHCGPVHALAFSPNGRLLASVAVDSTVRLWDPTIEEPPERIEGHTKGVRQVIFSPNGQLLASSAGDMAVRLWNPATGAQVRKLELHSESDGQVLFSPDGQRLASTSKDATLTLWDIASGERVQQSKSHTDSVTALAFSHDGKLLVSASAERVQTWNLVTGEQTQILSSGSSKVSRAVYSPDSHLLALVSYSVVTLWNSTSGKKVQTLNAPSELIQRVAFSSDGRLLVSSSVGTAVRLWNVLTGEQVQNPIHHDVYNRELALSHDGRLLALVSDSKLTICNLATGVQVQEQGHRRAFQRLNIWFSSDSQYLMTDQGILRLNTCSATAESSTLGPAYGIFFDGDWITYDGEDFLWLPHGYRGPCSAFNGNCLAIGQDSGQVHFIQFSPRPVI